MIEAFLVLLVHHISRFPSRTSPVRGNVVVLQLEVQPLYVRIREVHVRWHTSKCHKLQTPKAESITVNNMFHHFRVMSVNFHHIRNDFPVTGASKRKRPVSSSKKMQPKDQMSAASVEQISEHFLSDDVDLC